jgi:hypothetical protein
LLSFRVALGDRGALLSQTLTVAALVALLAASLSFTNLLSTSLSSKVPTAFAPLVSAVSSELTGLVLLWSIPIWVALLVAAYFLSLNSVRALAPSASLVAELGSYRLARRLCATRIAVVSVLGWVIGWSFGIVLVQVAFRVAAYAASAPYYVPSIGAAGLVEAAALTFSACALGALYPILRVKR